MAFIKKRENIILLGQCGVGKTHLAIALVYKAVQHRYKAKFTTIAELLSNTNKAKKERKYDAFLKPINIQGDSYRLKEKKDQGIINSDIYKIGNKSSNKSE